MKTSKIPSPSKKDPTAAAKPTAKEKVAVPVTANPRLVAALKSFDVARAETKTYLIDMATIVQEEQLSRSEVVASLMEGRGITKMTAESQYSRMKAILTDPDTLQKLKDGDIDLKAAREVTKKNQTNKSPEVTQKNAEKAYNKALTTIIVKAKELGISRQSLLEAIKSAAKKAGII